MADKLKIMHLGINEPKPAAYNPRKKLKAGDPEYQKIKRSIEEFGYVDPIIVNADYTVIGGHQRLTVLKDLGYLSIDCVVLDIDKTKEKALNIALNKISGEWDMDALKDVLSGLDEDDQLLTGFDMAELDELFAEPQEVGEDDFDADAALAEITEPVTKRGDIWQLGRHRLMCGDSTMIDDVDKLMDKNTANICFTSPPYNAGKSESLSGNTHMKDNKYINYKDENNNYLQLLMDFTKTVLISSEYVFINIQQLAGNKFDVIDYLYNFKDNFVDVVIWKKTNTAPAMAKNVLNSQFEYVYIFKNEINPSRAINTANFRGTISNIYEGPPQRQNEFSEIHAATFPVHLPSHFIKSFTQINGIILDCFGGTGTTLIACEQLNRICYMMELDEKYCDVIIKRWEEYTGQKAELIVG